ncbi:uncharacterized protein LOC127249538 [Andrographis paniculata]|uniref:uncharacterized protein LOC127249538 n=1 Tax=Andrographis paniculata TaxID=175694 RepID=UPI0021E940CE|nr:uncharacterized protein LOC127249538 [Andrographis paniculata]
MASIRSATRYTNSLNSSTKSDPSSSTELPLSCTALTKKTTAGGGGQMNLGSMVKKLVETKKARNLDKAPKFIIASDALAADLKKPAKKSSGLSGLHKKLFKGSSGSSSSLAAGKSGNENSKKALTEVKGNARTLAMVLKSERELLNLTKQQEEEIAELNLLIQEKNNEVEKLKDLCLKQREEIKSLKNAVLFPDSVNSELNGVLEKQSSELKQAKNLIPSLQRQVTSLTGQLQSLAQDLAEVKMEKCLGQGYLSPSMPGWNDQQESANSLFDQGFSSGDFTTTPDSPDDMFLKDLNPCLTPRSKTRSKEFDVYGTPDEPAYSSCANNKLSKSSESCQSSNPGMSSIRPIRWSDGSSRARGKITRNKFL